MDFSQFVEGNALVIRFTAVNVNELIKFLQDNRNISTLILHANGINGESGEVVLANFINAEDIEALANGNLVNLTRLDLIGNKIGDKGAEALANGNLVNLTRLDLNGNKIGDKGVEALANGNLVNLTRLDLGSNEIGDKGAEALASGNLVNLTRLDLSRNRITNKGLEALDKKVSDFISINLLWNRVNILPFYVHKVTATVAPFACLLLLGLGVASFTGAVTLTPTVGIIAALSVAVVAYSIGVLVSKVDKEKHRSPNMSTFDAIKNAFSDVYITRHLEPRGGFPYESAEFRR
ncbi:Internalin-A precursor [Wolbachia endosymbiont of Cylisticus convexus]|uniref:hypothetical protein n=1 Tax=Wolbachia endosymbiont of Cylisticus convexus TaxID=118728 RepID=UPI000DF6FCF1|nr:hypothetical protein [Wolbachia endosymbiont of Cylisticus convexus]RDD35199.1 Internalin-A precursor [Wolbachia endosymbiont of Cylisticus convexus]